MKVKIAILGAAVALALSGSALAYVERPPIGEHVTEQRVVKYLRGYPGWRYREDGFIDCWRGRINGYTWGCRVAWEVASAAAVTGACGSPTNTPNEASSIT